MPSRLTWSLNWDHCNWHFSASQPHALWHALPSGGGVYGSGSISSRVINSLTTAMRYIITNISLRRVGKDARASRNRARSHFCFECRYIKVSNMWSTDKLFPYHRLSLIATIRMDRCCHDRPCHSSH